jgi:hypothetical protein
MTTIDVETTNAICNMTSVRDGPFRSDNQKGSLGARRKAVGRVRCAGIFKLSL